MHLIVPNYSCWLHGNTKRDIVLQELLGLAAGVVFSRRWGYWRSLGPAAAVEIADNFGLAVGQVCIGCSHKMQGESMTRNNTPGLTSANHFPVVVPPFGMPLLRCPSDTLYWGPIYSNPFFKRLPPLTIWSALPPPPRTSTCHPS